MAACRLRRFAPFRCRCRSRRWHGRGHIVLLGELHDNVVQHRLRLQWLRALSERTQVTIVLEHLDADAQPRLDQARLTQDARLPVSARARQLAEAAGFRFDGWDWALIGPVVELALERDLPIRAANLSSREAFSIARGQPHPLGSAVPSGWTPEVEERMAHAIRDGHCGLLPEAMIPAMVRAQRARDARLAEVVLQARAAGRQPVLLAGNGHSGPIWACRFISGTARARQKSLQSVCWKRPPRQTRADLMRSGSPKRRNDPTRAKR